MTARGHGAVVHVSSNAARHPQPNGAPYAAAKAALNAYSMSLALACGPHGVRVTALMSGVIETDVVGAGLRRTAERTGHDLDTIRTEFTSALPPRSAAPDSPRKPQN
ncbi:SDR family NAD(P)-dependent oxidoreductase [Streptomyces sp. CG1]|uniref:SDR family NAD(P)-dependent oxidoreductase n=1 Tax=Streptomyces sp. CG1 TaxID=1287523 RepID=UPI0034E2B1CD